MGSDLAARTGSGPPDAHGGLGPDADLISADGPVVPATMQLLLPATPWDWPTDANGTSSAALYDFCSWMPATASGSAPYRPSGTRFSDGYRLFLQCLQSDGLTTQALSALANPSNLTTVLYAEQQQPRMPAWNVSQFPQAWLASVCTGSPTAGTISVTLPAAGEPAGAAAGTTCFGVLTATGQETPVPLAAGAGQTVEIHADAWGSISVRPAAWYDGALVALKRNGPYSAGATSVFFGAAGVLRNLLTGLYVALRPVVTASVASSVAAAIQDSMTSPGDQLRVGGLLLSEVTVAAPAGGRVGGLATVTATAVPSSSDVLIVGVTVADLA